MDDDVYYRVRRADGKYAELDEDGRVWWVHGSGCATRWIGHPHPGLLRLLGDPTARVVKVTVTRKAKKGKGRR